jgi:hypothetical protein
MSQFYFMQLLAFIYSVRLATTGSRLTAVQLTGVTDESCDVNALTTRLDLTQSGRSTKCSEFQKTGRTELSYERVHIVRRNSTR